MMPFISYVTEFYKRFQVFYLIKESESIFSVSEMLLCEMHFDMQRKMVQSSCQSQARVPRKLLLQE